jgi:hypothetical protein
MTESQVGRGPAPEEIRFRLGIRQRMPPGILIAACMGFDAVLRSVTDDRQPAFDAWFTAVWVVLVVLSVTVSPFGITLTPSTARVRNLRRRIIPWASVQNVCVEPVMGGRVIVLYEADGRRTQLRAPITGFLQRDRRFEEKFHVIGQWWQTHRGTDWVPLPHPGAIPLWALPTPGHPAAPGSPAAPPAPPTS